MYEQQTYEAVRDRMLEAVPNSVDKREGSIIFDATAPAAIEISLLYAVQDYFLKNTFGDTAERPFLIERAKERNIHPYPATVAKVKIKCLPITLNVAIGARFSYDDVNFAVIDRLGDGFYLAECEAKGTQGNKAAGKMVPIDYVAGLQSVELEEITVPGEDEEETEHLRERYLRSFSQMAYGGNIADYREKVNAISGVGGVKVYPVWNGGGTVRIAFMTSENGVPTSEFVDEVQTLIDPVTNHGEGVGIAPIGHHVTVGGVSNSNIKIDLNISVTAGTSASNYTTKINNVIDDYFGELNAGWEKTQVVRSDRYSNEGLRVLVSQMESRLLDIEGIEDIKDTALNDVAGNLTLGTDQLAVRGIVNVSEY